jgi:hypothetical protein
MSPTFISPAFLHLPRTKPISGFRPGFLAAETSSETHPLCVVIRCLDSRLDLQVHITPSHRMRSHQLQGNAASALSRL